MLVKADKILRTWSVEDIQNFLPDLVNQYCTLDIEATTKEKNYEIERISQYVWLKKDKKEKKNKYSDKDIDVISKKTALDKYWDYVLNKKIISHYKLYIEELRQRKIDLQVMNKALRDTIWH